MTKVSAFFWAIRHGLLMSPTEALELYRIVYEHKVRQAHQPSHHHETTQ